jgi:Spy/CpxP family protein refolding chaperone
MRRFNVLFTCLALGAAACTAAAQETPRPPGPPGERPGPGGPPGEGRGGFARQQLSPEKAKAAWELQATGVSTHAGLDADKTKAVVKAYVEARTSHNEESDKIRKEMEKLRDEGGGPGAGGFGPLVEKLEDLNKSERAKLEKSLGSSLSPEQATRVTASLGTFNRNWDNMVDTVAGFKLEDAKQTDALNAMEEFVIAQAKARASAGDDRDALRTAMQESRQKLLDSMKKVLSEEQLEKFEASLGRGRGPGGPGGPGGRGGRGGGGG